MDMKISATDVDDYKMTGDAAKLRELLAKASKVVANGGKVTIVRPYDKPEPGGEDVVDVFTTQEQVDAYLK